MFAIAAMIPGFHHGSTVVAIGTDPTPFIRPDPRRAILYVANPTDEDLSMWFVNGYDEEMPPHVFVPARTTWRFTWALDGPMSTYGWLASFRTTPASISFTEIHWLPDQLRQTLSGVA